MPKKESTKKEQEPVIREIEMLEEPTPEMKVDNSHEDLKDLIEKNIKWSQVIYTQNKAIKHRLTIMALLNYIKLALILTPIILGIIYLPPLMADLLEKYSSLINGGSGLGEVLKELIDATSSTSAQ